MRCYTLPSSYHLQKLTSPPLQFPSKTETTNNFYPPKPDSASTTRPALLVSVKASASFDAVAVEADEEGSVSLYEVLGVAVSGTEVELKKAYKKLARKYHPDVSPPGRAEEYTKRFIRVQQAYETLSDPVLRAVYDREMAMAIKFPISSRCCQARHRRQPHPCRHQVMEQRNEWKTRWESQLSGLKRRSQSKNDGRNESWAAQMRNNNN
ncbi:hypothetical protein PIB30_039151 [Stylosanthes scabra]|uniref:J domain-containing protein n=1 Tax=Stylosanthes scabra TaxID=79078 RepID=A0ABU6VFB4_9FABA|nr:hypothetical protein [Stylosanthes scabra]